MHFSNFLLFSHFSHFSRIARNASKTEYQYRNFSRISCKRREILAKTKKCEKSKKCGKFLIFWVREMQEIYRISPISHIYSNSRNSYNWSISYNGVSYNGQKSDRYRGFDLYNVTVIGGPTVLWDYGLQRNKLKKEIFWPWWFLRNAVRWTNYGIICFITQAPEVYLLKRFLYLQLKSVFCMKARN